MRFIAADDRQVSRFEEWTAGKGGHRSDPLGKPIQRTANRNIVIGIRRTCGQTLAIREGDISEALAPSAEGLGCH
ncbi:hypothetical protein CEF21_09800 [Bacillus sp. FJAT-42376]|uniref:hypothetical protein n=1 Tax=Bacillus sp. FJAT-42376 TaxID=2014076 RepID=UPI000F4D2EFC|nr:hypothetical protein [Bacillus sp. FJAT-42376]AZB42556.1 hypothetical protein CEF21_09800 [Bacillus sp. FJAT-42376]